MVAKNQHLVAVPEGRHFGSYESAFVAVPEGRHFGSYESAFVAVPEGRHFIILSHTLANTYTQISIQAVFAVKGRQNIISSQWRDELHQYIAGIIRKEAVSLAVGGWKDHVHVFFGLPPALRISDLIQKIKANSSKWINEKGFIKGRFSWQEGYSAFSYSRSQRDAVIKYIMNQEVHHKKRAFRDEYIEFLKKFEVLYEPRYLFEFYE